MADEPADERWAHTLGHLLWEVSAHTSQLSEATLARVPGDVTLTPASVGLLDQIASQPGTTIAEIARRTPKTPQAISQVVARLEKHGFVERRLAGGRAIGLHITESGAAARTAGTAAEDAVEAQLEDVLGSERYEALRRLLDEARTALSELDAPGGV
ncbi:MAG: transcriptional regulator, MarR family [Conexibacter sp.]|nr:transcriptional regulator, MarR family [Conexibacter sp.]